MAGDPLPLNSQSTIVPEIKINSDIIQFYFTLFSLFKLEPLANWIIWILANEPIIQPQVCIEIAQISLYMYCSMTEGSVIQYFNSCQQMLPLSYKENTHTIYLYLYTHTQKLRLCFCSSHLAYSREVHVLGGGGGCRKLMSEQNIPGLKEVIGHGCERGREWDSTCEGGREAECG